MILKEIGLIGQTKLQRAKVLVIGAGGIGSPALMYLAGCGIGTLGIIDGDTVEESNLHRQIIHKTKTIGKNKAFSAQESIFVFNPSTKVTPYTFRLTQLNAFDIIKDYDLVLDASDNAATRYLVNDTCVLANVSLFSKYSENFGFRSQYRLGRLNYCLWT